MIIRPIAQTSVIVSLAILGVVVVLAILAGHAQRQFSSFAGEISQSPHAKTRLMAESPTVSTGELQNSRQEDELPDLLPDFASQSVVERKQAFVSFVLPYVERENTRLSEIRQRLENLALSKDLSAEEMGWVQTIAARFRLRDASDPIGMIDQLLVRVDTLPPSLVLAQAAIESGWGTSRFARKGNNIFGHWCMSPGCGLVPRNRPAMASYEVKKFPNVGQAVQGYFMNLNTNPAYHDLREIRACHRSMGESLSGLIMAGGLLAYSGRGTDYIESVRGLISSNEWHEMDGERSELSDCERTDQYQNTVALAEYPQF